MKSVTTILLFLSCTFFCQAANVDELFHSANDAYKKKDFPAATGLYEQVVQAGFQSAELEYNLANAYFRQEKIGKSILHYERALRLSPGDEDIGHNLSLTRMLVKDEFQPLPQFFLSLWWKNAGAATSSGLWGSLALLLWWAGLAGAAIWLLGKTRERKKTGFLVSISCLLLSLLPFGLALSQASNEVNSRSAIVMAKEAALRSAPDENGTEIMTLHEGVKTEIETSLGDWFKVRLPNGEEGWILKNEVEKI